MYVGGVNRLFDAKPCAIEGRRAPFTVELRSAEERLNGLSAPGRVSATPIIANRICAGSRKTEEVLEMNQHALRREVEHMLDGLVCVWRSNKAMSN